jgi:hypothetical protein
MQTLAPLLTPYFSVLRHFPEVHAQHIVPGAERVQVARNEAAPSRPAHQWRNQLPLEHATVEGSFVRTARELADLMPAAMLARQTGDLKRIEAIEHAGRTLIERFTARCRIERDEHAPLLPLTQQMLRSLLGEV